MPSSPFHITLHPGLPYVPPTGDGDDCAGRPKPRPRRVTLKHLPQVKPSGPTCTCGKELPKETGMAGRPKAYCGQHLGRFVLQADKVTKKWVPEDQLDPAQYASGTDACREFSSVLAQLERWAEVIAPDSTWDGGWGEVRMRLFQLANIRTWNKGLKLPPRTVPGA